MNDPVVLVANIKNIIRIIAWQTKSNWSEKNVMDYPQSKTVTLVVQTGDVIILAGDRTRDSFKDTGHYNLVEI